VLVVASIAVPSKNSTLPTGTGAAVEAAATDWAVVFVALTVAVSVTARPRGCGLLGDTDRVVVVGRPLVATLHVKPFGSVVFGTAVKAISTIQ
jgi:hypothetical protein